MRTLLADDDLVSRRLMQILLLQYGECDVVDNGEKAIRFFRSSLYETRHYNLICLDIMMPEMDGQMALQEIRKMEKDFPEINRTKIIMTTALHDSNNVIQAIRSQCDGYLIKPIDKKKLHKQLQNLKLL